MNGPEHYREAERLLERAGENLAGDEYERWDHDATVAEAQVHATLALAAATADEAVTRWIGDENRSGSDWTKAIS